ncbi:MAG: hypothetical protein FWD78_17275 [Treponema sp.]|nr:hypothetical protein [Treponema sp.]
MIVYHNTDLSLIGDTQRLVAMVHPLNLAYSDPLMKGIAERCRFYIAPLYALCIFTLERGHHACGWWKNPDYDACWHLSISFQDLESGDLAPQDHKAAQRIIQGFFQSHRRLIWTEPPYTEKGKSRDVWHYRLFIDWATKLPLLPRGEVYTRQFTEAGWKSYSEVQAMIQKQEQEKPDS